MYNKHIKIYKSHPRSACNNYIQRIEKFVQLSEGGKSYNKYGAKTQKVE
jgi:hypothetical protein